MKNSIESKKKQNIKLPTKQSVQDVYTMRNNSKKLFKRPSR